MTLRQHDKNHWNLGNKFDKSYPQLYPQVVDIYVDKYYLYNLDITTCFKKSREFDKVLFYILY